MDLQTYGEISAYDIFPTKGLNNMNGSSNSCQNRAAFTLEGY